MSSGISIEQLMVYSLNLVPPALVWIVIVYFCFMKHRENPRGATYLGLAIMVHILGYGINLVMTFARPDWLKDLTSTEWVRYAQQGLYGFLHAVVWIFIGMAVFSRRADQYADLE